VTYEWLQPAGARITRNFRRFWIGETVSLFGTQVTMFALPLVAVVDLHATPGQVGTLQALQYLPFLFFSLLLGGVVDRHARRPIMLAVNVARAVLIGLVPLLVALHALRLPMLYAIVFLVGVGTVVFDLCYLSFVPSVVAKEGLVAANGRLAVSQSTAEVAGPGLGGVLVQLLTAPVVLLVDAVSYVVSVAYLARIPADRPPVAPSARRRLLAEIRDGLRFVARERFIRALAVQGALYAFAYMATSTLFLLYAVRELKFSAGLLGLVLAAGSLGGVIGAAAADRFTARWPYGRLHVVAVAVGCLPFLAVPAAGGPAALLTVVFVVAFFACDLGSATANVLSVTVRQSVTPTALLGRANAAVRTIHYGVGSLGAVAGGALGSAIGLRLALWVGAGVYVAAFVAILLSPVPGSRTVPAHPAVAPPNEPLTTAST
jgi:MFS family permease